MKLAGDALREYFSRKNINPRPRNETVRIDVEWNYYGPNYLATYSPATQSLQIWVKVAPGTHRAVLIGQAGLGAPATGNQEEEHRWR
jgi:hypothetical protein